MWCSRIQISQTVFSLLAVLCTFFLCELARNKTYHVQENSTSKNVDQDHTLLGISPMPCAIDHRPSWQIAIEEKSKNSLLAGHQPQNVKKLVLGLASVWRRQNYLQKTLQALIDQSEVEERQMAVIVICLADQEEEKISQQIEMVKKNFQKFLDTGFFLIIRTTKEIYPPMEAALEKRTYNNSNRRIFWRTKQVIDFAFLINFAHNLSNFYMVMEDDLSVAPRYLTAILDFVEERKERNWNALKFSEFIGIGLLFRNADLPTLNKILVMFHGNHPVDILMNIFIHLQGSTESDSIVWKRTPSLFQHVGKVSTLRGKVQRIKDKSFGVAARRFKNQNPRAQLVTSMTIDSEFYPSYAYKVTPGFFAGLAKLAGDTLDILFELPQNISRIVIISGLTQEFWYEKRLYHDPIEKAALLYAKYEELSDEWRHLQNFHEGCVDFIGNLSQVVKLRIKLEPDIRNPVIIREIQIFTK